MNMFPVMIIAGGYGNRLGSLTKDNPKSLVPINKKPFLYYQLKLLVKNKINRVIICTNYLGNLIIDFVENSSFKKDLVIEFSSDGDQCLGTGGALIKAMAQLNNDNFFVMYGDSYLDCNFANIQLEYIKQKCPAMMTLFKNNNMYDKSNIELLNKKIVRYDKINKTNKMNCIDYGLGVFSKSSIMKTFPFLKANDPYDLTFIYQTYLCRNQLSYCTIRNRFYEVGSVKGIKELSRHLSKIEE